MILLLYHFKFVIQIIILNTMEKMAQSFANRRCKPNAQLKNIDIWLQNLPKIKIMIMVDVVYYYVLFICTLWY